MSYIEYVHADDTDQMEPGSLWLDSGNLDIWVLSDSVRNYMVRLKDGYTVFLTQDADGKYETTGFIRFRGTITINTEV